MEKFFGKFATKAAKATASAWAFILAALVISAWAVSGPYFGYSETWQLVINTGTTIVTFLMVFLIQNTQNRDARALHLKIDELLISITNARNEFVDIEELSTVELEALAQEVKSECRSAAPSMHKDKHQRADGGPSGPEKKRRHIITRPRSESTNSSLK